MKRIVLGLVLIVAFAGRILAAPNPEAAAALREGKALESRDPEGALAAYRRAIALQSDWVEAHRAYQAQMRALGRLDQARREYETRRAREPESALAWYLLGRVLEGGERLQAFVRATELDPGFFWGWFALGQARLAGGDPAAAAACFRRATEVDPTAADAWIGLGEAQHAARETNPALRSFRRAEELDPSSSAAHLGAGRCLKALGNWDDAITAAEKVLVGRPADLEALELAAQCAHGAAAWERAAAYRRRAGTAWQAAKDRRPVHAAGIVIDAVAVARGYLIVHERFDPPGLVFAVHREGREEAEMSFEFAGGVLRDAVTSAVIWSPGADAAYPEIRRRAEAVAARRLEGQKQ